MRDRRDARELIASVVAVNGLKIGVHDVRFLAASTQAKVFLVTTGGAESLIAKIFREGRLDVAAAVTDEFDSLTLMDRVFRDSAVEGWAVHAPKPLFMSLQPPSLLMTEVPGNRVNDELRRLENNERRDLARGISNALALYWSSTDRMIGDVTLSNILVDMAGRRLGFVDPGLPEASFTCEEVSARFAPCSRDLAFLLVHVLATNVRTELFNNSLARRRASFAREVISQFIVQHLEPGSLDEFLEEFHECAKRHIRRIPVGGPKEPWRRFLRNRVSNRVQDAVDQLKGR